MKHTPLYDHDHTIHINSQVLDVTDRANPSEFADKQFDLDAGLQIVNGNSATHLDFSVYALVPKGSLAVNTELAVLQIQRERAAVERLRDHVEAFHEAFMKATDAALDAVS